MRNVMTLRFQIAGGNIYGIKMNDSTFFRYNNLMVIYSGLHE